MHLANPSAPSEERPLAFEAECADEAGFMLAAVVVMVALVLIALSVAAPVIARQLRRDKEVESEHRAEQYVRAIRLYYRKFHSYPASIDALKQTSNIRFLRQEYTDPLTGKADWRLIHLGEQKTTVKGFFGQDIGGLASGGGMGSGLGSAANMSSGIGSPIGGAGAGSSGGGVSPLGAGLANTTTGSTDATGAAGSTGSAGGTGLTSSLGAGGVIVGVGPAATGTSILTPNQQTTYETWEFWYDPRIEQMYQKGHTNMGMGGGSLNSQPASGFGTNLNGQPNSNSGGSSFGSPIGGGGVGSSGGGFGAGSSTSPTQPQ